MADPRDVAQLEEQVAHDLIGLKAQRDERSMRLFALIDSWLQEEREANDIRRGDDLKEGQGRAQALSRLSSFYRSTEAMLASLQARRAQLAQQRNGAGR